MKLTDTAVRNARPGDRPKKLFDGDGLYCSSQQPGIGPRILAHLERAPRA